MINRNSFISGMVFGISSIAFITSILLLPKHSLRYIDIPLLILSSIGLLFSYKTISKTEKGDQK